MKFHCVPQLVRLRHRLAHEMKWYKFVHKVLCCIFLFHEAHKFRASECMLYEKAIVNVIFIVVASVADAVAAAAAFVASGHCRSIFAQCAFRFREFIVVECVFFSLLFAIIRVLFAWRRWGLHACNINFIKYKSKSFRVSSLEQYIAVEVILLALVVSQSKLLKLCTKKQTAKCRLTRSIYVRQTSFGFVIRINFSICLFFTSPACIFAGRICRETRIKWALWGENETKIAFLTEIYK